MTITFSESSAFEERSCVITFDLATLVLFSLSAYKGKMVWV